MLDEMPFSPSLSNSQVYREFKEIEAREYRTIVRFFEEFEQDIYHLRFEEYFELLLAYVDALFEIGAYANHLKTVDQLIEISINHNITFYKGEDIFFELVFKKAAAHYNLHQYDKAEQILRELIKIDPENKLAIRFLIKCVHHDQPKFLKQTRGTSVLIFLITAATISVELVFIRSLYSSYGSVIELLRNVLFILGWVVLLLGEGVHLFKVRKLVTRFVSRIKIGKR